MKLEGSLDAFGLPDIFQLLSFTKKTGGLRLRQAGLDGVVYFASGQVTGATADVTRQSLARRLIGTGVVSDQDVQQALRRSTDSGTGVAKALFEAGSLDSELVRAAALEHTFDAVFDLLRWPEGDFAFTVDDANPDEMGVTVPAERLVSEAAQRREAFEAASAVIPSPDSLLAMPVAVPEQLQLSRDDWALLALVDGRRRAHELIELTGRGSVAVLSALADLVGRGLLEVTAEGSDLATTMRRRLDLLAPLEGRAAPRVADSPETAQPDSRPDSQPERPSQPAPDASRVTTIGGPHVPNNVVPPRPEPYLPSRQVEHADEAAGVGAMSAAAASRGGFGSAAAAASSASPNLDRPSPPANGSFASVNGSAAMAVQEQEPALIERDPNVSRSLLLRLIAGVRGL